MPAPRAAAAFEPIPPDLDLPALVEATDNFEYAVRLSCDMIDSHGIEQFEKLVLLHVVIGGKPLVIEGFQNRLDRWTFSTQWLRDNVGKKFEQARDLTKGEYLPLSINHYLDNMSMLANQWTPQNYKLPKQRLYLKDIDCPELWVDKLREHIPPSLFYLDKCTGEGVGQGTLDKPREFSRAGDLMSCLPPSMRAENMMCYIGHEGTYTPAHREMCASLGQNIMVEASGLIGEDGKPTKPGSSIWFMTETKDRHLVAEYWLSTLGHDIEVETHFAQINAWAKAPFKVYIVEQRVGDFILIPPLAPHQVWNRGTRTVKAAWNRTTVETLEMALNEALPRARMVCRDEQYKNKAIVLFSLNRYSTILRNVEYQKTITRDREALLQLTSGTKIKRIQKDFKRLFRLFNEILLSETFSPEMHEKKAEYIPFDSNITCSYCRGNIFNRFLTCKNCTLPLDDGSEDTYDICMECYAMGRSCQCLSKLTWVEQFPWKDLLRKHENWRKQLLEIERGTSSKSALPLSLEEERRKMDKKTLAEICQEQLRLRPFQDPNKKHEQDDENAEEGKEGRDEDSPCKRTKKKRSEKWLRENLPCHICAWRHPKWRMAVCECGVAFCYGSLWRGFDMMPQTIMEDPFWRCPKCREICNCSPCRKGSYNHPYQPSGTVLGHDTRKFADPRSVEALVDFSSSNSHWLKKAGDDVAPAETRRMQRRIFEAEHAKSQRLALDDDDEEGSEAAEPVRRSASSYEEVPIDPLIIAEAGTQDAAKRDADDSRRVARNALSAMDGLSQLEQDTGGFIALARRDGAFPRNKEDMIIRTAPNGISYGIPNPNKIMDETGQAKEKKDKRQRKPGYKKRIEGEAAQFANDANRRFYRSQTEKTMAKAKKTGHIISARAAITGDRLIVKLKLSPVHIIRFTQPDEVGPSAGPVMDEDAPTAQVQSNLPKNAPPSPSASKKRHRSEKDNEFRAQRNRRKRPMTERQSVTSEDGDYSSDTEHNIIAQAPQRSTEGPKRRSLPAYLARRSPVKDSELPKELTGAARRRSTTTNMPKPRQPVERPPGRRPVGRPPGRSAARAIPQRSRRDSDSYSSGGNTSEVEPDDRTKPTVPVALLRVPPASEIQSRRAPRTAPTADELNHRAKLRAANDELVSSDLSEEDEDSDIDSLIARTPQGRGVAKVPRRRHHRLLEQQKKHPRMLPAEETKIPPKTSRGAVMK